MWQIVAFDLPVDDKVQQKIYRTFRKKLLAAGYNALQKSIYIRWFESHEKAMTSQKEIFDHPPDVGDIFAIGVTDDVFLKSVHVSDKSLFPAPHPPDNYSIY